MDSDTDQDVSPRRVSHHRKIHQRNDSERGDGGVSFSELVKRLLSLPRNKSDSKFVPSFLCLYRTFATPQQLLVAIVEEFVSIEQSEMVQFSKVAELLRYLQVLGQWSATYPGDFAGMEVRELATVFLKRLENSKMLAPAAKEISNNLQVAVQDDDYDWAYDEPIEAESEDLKPLHKKKSSSASTSRSKSLTTFIESDESGSETETQANTSSRHSGSASTASSMLKLSLTSSQSATNLYALEAAREQARKLRSRSIPHIGLTKLEWHQFMETPTEELAQEITRIDWTMYSAIRPRDFVRYVCLSPHKRAFSRHPDTIGMMVKHFNHLALLVSGLILLRDKPKHRARMLEKLMDLAWKIRQLNNYNSLGAIVAGITGHEITRLRQTHDLVPHETQKSFLRLTVLMSTSRSYAAYRMAWDNSFHERIPFIPLVRQDLTLAASANQTFIGRNVNWRKFQIMGDVIVGVQRSQQQPHVFPKRTQMSRDISRLVLETKIIDESEESADPRSELYDRSVHLEPQIGTEAKKKFDWLWR